MIHLDKNGNISVVNGYDGGVYTPRYEDRTSVYLGDMTSEDMRVKAEVKARREAAKRMDSKVALMKARAEQRKYLIADYLARKKHQAEVQTDRYIKRVSDQKVHRAMASGKLADISPWRGNPFAGFGQLGEERINPDSNSVIDIVDADIPSVKEYGVQDWNTDPKSYDDRIADSAAAYTPGKQVLQTMVDYASKLDKSVVGLPAAIADMTQDQRNQYLSYLDQNKQTVDPKMVKYGLYALGLFILLR